MSQISFIKTLPQQLGQPTAIAIVASLGIHALLGLSLPSISKASKQAEQNPLGHVKVVQLTPAEESRVPSLTPSPTVQQQSLPYQIQPLPPMPQLPYSISYPPLPSSPSISPNIPSDFWLTPPVKETKSKSSKATKSKSKQTQDKQNSKQRFFNPPAPEPITPASALRRLPNSPFDLVTPASPPPGVDTHTSPQPADPGSPQPAANNPSKKTLNPSQQQLADIRQLRDSLVYNKEGTSSNDYRDKFTNWASKNPNVLSKDSKYQQITLAPSYPKEACLKKLEGTVIVGAQVDANGKVSLDILKNSGYDLLDHKALDTVNKYEFPKGEKAYAVQVKFEYEKKSCPALAAPQAPSEPKG